ncbi:MAG: tetratricopeptide repeat protein [Flavobacteriales bacterium]|nr:tetratricopeptide repeat protein [Flavobacteriales bacterium]MCX7769312.1 tetratricopeptide repeat protein [Flavobacteriales bacterium]MDW8410502.1 tetratricopeptide repeat protein [Flavobacteriales bacterium]
MSILVELGMRMSALPSISFRIFFISLATWVGVGLGCEGRGGEASQKSKSNSNLTDSYLDNLNLLIEESPRNPELYYQRGTFHLEKDNVFSALRDARKAVELDSSKAEYHLLLADVHFKLGQFSETRKILEKLLVRFPEHTETLLKNAEFQLYLQDYPKVFELVNRALQQSAYIPRAYFIKGIAYLEMKDTALAQSSFETVVDLDPDYFHAHMQLGLIYGARLNPLCEYHFRQAMRLNPQKPESYYGLAYYYQQIGEIDKAIDMYKVLLHNVPGNPAALFNLGYLYLLEKKEYRIAIEYFSEAIKYDSKYAEAFYNRGYAYELLGNVQAAAQDYRNALALKPDFRLARKGLTRLGFKPKE